MISTFSLDLHLPSMFFLNKLAITIYIYIYIYIYMCVCVCEYICVYFEIYLKSLKKQNKFMMEYNLEFSCILNQPPWKKKIYIYIPIEATTSTYLAVLNALNIIVLRNEICDQSSNPRQGFHFILMPLGKTFIHLFSLSQLWVNSKAVWVF